MNSIFVSVAPEPEALEPAAVTRIDSAAVRGNWPDASVVAPAAPAPAARTDWSGPKIEDWGALDSNWESGM